jgi:hypothetical protein
MWPPDEFLNLARTLGIWPVACCGHRSSGDRKPHNSVYVINEQRADIDRHDKRFAPGPISSSDRNTTVPSADEGALIGIDGYHLRDVITKVVSTRLSSPDPVTVMGTPSVPVASPVI